MSGPPAAAAIAILATATACGSGAVDGGSRPPADAEAGAAEFVGSAACASCHAAEHGRWLGSHHDRAMQVAGEGTVLGDFDDAVFEQQGARTRFFRRGGALMVETEGGNGEPIELEVAFTFGVDPLQQYLVATDGGRYQALDVAWDARPADAGGQRWFSLQPGVRYPPGDPLHWTGIAYNWNTMCADCHSTGFAKEYDVATRSYRSRYAEVDVGCEACHGPGSVHVDWATAASVRAGEAPITAGPSPAAASEAAAAAPVGLVVGFSGVADASWPIDPTTGLARRVPERSSRAEIETCGRCHARRGNIVESHAFGRPLTDAYRVSLLDRGLYHDDGQILDEVYVYGSFLQSRMHQRGVSCSDCHEPHGLTLRNQGNALCNRCHLAERFDAPSHHHHEPDSESAACVSCHMPATTYMVVDPRRDHSFRVPRPDLTVRFGTPNACGDCHASEGPEWAAAAVREWFGPQRPVSYGARLAEGRSAGVDAGAELLSLARDREAPPIVRATALAELPIRSQAAVTALGEALGDASPLVRAGALRALAVADPATAVRLSLPHVADPDRMVRLEAARLLASVPEPSVPAPQRDAVEGAIAEYRAAQAIDADRAQGHLNLGWLAAQRGDWGEAERAYREALDLEPYFVPAFINLADLYRISGRDAEGEALLQQALGIAPDSGDVRYALGLLLVRDGRLAEAVEELRRAAELSPEQPHYTYVYAVAMHTTGDVDGAIELLDGGLQRFPTDPEFLFGAAAFSREAGDIERALGYARRLVAADPTDPQAIALLRQLEGRDP